MEIVDMSKAFDELSIHWSPTTGPLWWDGTYLMYEPGETGGVVEHGLSLPSDALQLVIADYQEHRDGPAEAEVLEELERLRTENAQLRDENGLLRAANALSAVHATEQVHNVLAAYRGQGTRTRLSVELMDALDALRVAVEGK